MDTGVEPAELPGPAPERAQSEIGLIIDCAMAERDVVAGPDDVEDDVAVQLDRPSRLGIDNPQPTVIALRFEDVIVQKPPARPVAFEQSFVTWRAPLRREDADTEAEATPGLSERFGTIRQRPVRARRPSVRMLKP